jgi:hypothetical protein
VVQATSEGYRHIELMAVIVEWLENGELEPIETLSLELSENSEEDQKPKRFNRWDSNRTHSEYKAEV